MPTLPKRRILDGVKTGNDRPLYSQLPAPKQAFSAPNQAPEEPSWSLEEEPGRSLEGAQTEPGWSLEGARMESGWSLGLEPKIRNENEKRLPVLD